MKNQFENDAERILELKSCLEEVEKILNTEGVSGLNKAHTLIKDVLYRYDQDLKFITAEVNKVGPFEFLKDE